MSYDEKDLASYQQLEESSNPQKKNRRTRSFGYAEQQRAHVSKEICVQKELPLLCRIVSESSELFFLPDEENHIDVIEEMDHVSGFIQEELFYVLPDGREALPTKEGKLLLRNGDPKKAQSWIDPASTSLQPMQLVRYFEAERASYHYNAQLFVGEEVKLWKYRLQGHGPLASRKGLVPLMTGKAESVEFAFQESDLDLRARHFQATFEAKGKGL